MAAAGTLMLVFPLVQGRELGWPAWIIAMLAGSVAVLAAFGARQVRRKREGATVLIETSVFRKREYVSGVGFALIFLAAMGGVMLSLGVFMQEGLGYSPIHAALATAPFALGGFVGAAIGGMTMAKLGRTVLQAGLVLKATGFPRSTSCSRPSARTSGASTSRRRC